MLFVLPVLFGGHVVVLMEDWASTQAALDLRGMVVGEMVCWLFKESIQHRRGWTNCYNRYVKVLDGVVIVCWRSGVGF